MTYIQTWKYNNTRNTISFSVSKISFIFLQFIFIFLKFILSVKFLLFSLFFSLILLMIKILSTELFNVILFNPHQIFLNRCFVWLFEFIYVYLNEEDRVCKRYHCLMIQAHLHIGFTTIFFIKPASIKSFYLYMKLLQSGTIFKQKIIIKCLVIKSFPWNFLQHQIQKT